MINSKPIDMDERDISNTKIITRGRAKNGADVDSPHKIKI
jgi:hypothetical protein